MAASELTAQEKKQLLAALRDLAPKVKNERRTASRRDVQLNLVIRKIKSGKLESNSANGKRSLRAVSEVDIFTATILNVAPRGVAISVRKPLEAGDKLLLPLRFREGGGWLVLCEVRNCTTLDNGRYKVGAHFIDRVEDPDDSAKIPMDWIL